jgi:hypothetical protein
MGGSCQWTVVRGQWSVDRASGLWSEVGGRWTVPVDCGQGLVDGDPWTEVGDAQDPVCPNFPL